MFHLSTDFIVGSFFLEDGNKLRNAQRGNIKPFPLQREEVLQTKLVLFAASLCTNKDIGIDKDSVAVHHAMISWYFFISAGVSKSRFFDAQDFMAAL